MALTQWTVYLKIPLEGADRLDVEETARALEEALSEHQAAVTLSSGSFSAQGWCLATDADAAARTARDAVEHACMSLGLAACPPTEVHVTLWPAQGRPPRD